MVFAALFVVVACWPLLDSEAPRWWGFAAAAAVAAAALLKPAILAGPNRLWIRLGVLLGRVVGPLALAVLYYVIVSPLGVAMRWSGTDPLRLRVEPGTDSYWIPRTPPGPPPDSLTEQF